MPSLRLRNTLLPSLIGGLLLFGVVVGYSLYLVSTSQVASRSTPQVKAYPIQVITTEMLNSAGIFSQLTTLLPSGSVSGGVNAVPVATPVPISSGDLGKPDLGAPN